MAGLKAEVQVLRCIVSHSHIEDESARSGFAKVG